MSAERLQLLIDYKLTLRKELADFTATSSSNSFPETLNAFCGYESEHHTMVLAYMEARFQFLEALSLMQTILKRRIQIGDIDFIMKHGTLPKVTKHSGGHQAPGSVPTTDNRYGTVIKNLAKIIKRSEFLVQNIINDHPTRLNLYAYVLLQAAFSGDARNRLMLMEKAVFRLILERQAGNSAPRRCPSIVERLAIYSRDILLSYPDELSLSDKLRLRAMLSVAERWKFYRGDRAEKFEIHFSLFPQAFLRSSRPLLREGMMLVEPDEIDEFCSELFGLVLPVISRWTLTPPEKRPLYLEKSLRVLQHRVEKYIHFATDQSEIGSITQLRRDLPLLPPCIYSLIARLQRDHLLPNYERYLLLCYFRNIKLPMREAEKYFREIYNMNANPSEQWTTVRAGHLRRVYLNDKRSQLRCRSFDRYCVWRRGTDNDAKRTLVKIRKGQQDLRAPGLFCCGNDFQKLLGALGNVSNSDDARVNCATLGCFQKSETPFFSPLGYYYNTKKIAAGTATANGSETDYQSDSSSEDSHSQ